MYICVPISYPGPKSCIELSPLSLNYRRKVTLRMIPGYRNNRFEIAVDPLGHNSPVPEELRRSIKFPNYLGTFHNVKVYQKSPNVAEIQHYKFKSGLTNSNQYEVVYTLYSLYRVRLNVRMTGATKPGVTNLMHVGDQITMNIPPNSRKLEICLNANGQVCVTTDRDDLSWKRDTEIEVCCFDNFKIPLSQ